MLGPNVAEIKIREIIRREEIEPSLADTSRVPPWADIEERVEGKYGALGRQANYGAQMMYALEHEDWRGFGGYFALYFETAFPGSDYPINALSRQSVQQVDNPRALDARNQGTPVEHGIRGHKLRRRRER